MRISLCLLALLLASPGKAATITLTGSRNLDTVPHFARRDLGIRLIRADFGTPIEIAAVATVEVGPVGDVSKSWTITEANAGEFGLDWAAAESWVDAFATRPVESYQLRVVSFHGSNVTNHNDLGPGLANQQRIVGGTLDHIELTQRYWIDQQPFGIAGTSWSIVIQGTVVPEPASWVLVVMTGFCSLVARRR